MNTNSNLLNEFGKIVKGMDLDTLRKCRDILGEHIDLARREAGMEVKSKIFPGMVVRVNHHKLAGKECEVVEIKRTKAVIRVVNGGKYNVPLSMILP